MKFARGLFLLIFLAALGLYAYANVLPYHFSPQNPLEPENLMGYYDKTHEKGTFHGVDVESYFIPEPEKLAKTLGNSTGASKRIEVDLTNQRVYAFEGDTKVYDFLVSTGKWGRTPTGTFAIWTKLRATRMSGGNSALGTYYNLPNVPYVMFFSNDQISRSSGYSLHGTYWHSNFGHPMSHGCVNMRIEDAEKIYYWANPGLNGKASISATADNPGTQITIYGTAPAE